MGKIRILFVGNHQIQESMKACTDIFEGNQIGSYFDRGVILDRVKEVGDALIKTEIIPYHLIFFGVQEKDPSVRDSLEALRDLSVRAAVIVVTERAGGSFTLQLLRAGAQDVFGETELLSSQVLKRARFAIERFHEKSELVKKLGDLEAFTSVATHDLKSPLYKISEASELLLSGEITDEAEQRIFLGMMNRSARRLGTLIDDLLTLSRIGKAGTVLEKVSMNEVVDEVIDELALQIREANATIERDDLPVIRGNHSGLSLLFQNLISNALKYRDESRAPEIKITAEENDHYFRFSVSDNGKGIHENDLEKVFKPFVRGMGSEGQDGSGIGLATCRRLADVHEGRIKAASIWGEGTTVTLEIPLAYGINAESADLQVTHPEDDKTNGIVRKRVLLVEDNKLQARTLTQVLERQGFDVKTFLDPRQALRASKSEEFDCIVTDLMMPGLSGEQLLENIRKHSDVPVIVYSAIATQARRRMMSLGATDCIEKGTTPEDLLGAVAQAIS